MVNVHTCPKCGSNHWDYANVGLPDALQCTDCGCVYPEVLSLFPKLIKTEESWPFPTSLRPQKHGLPKYNPNNEEESPL
jgi:hypothetical protein